MDFATAFNKVVLPALGGDTIIPLCPLPTGLIRSMIRMATEAPGVSSLSLSLGKIGVRSSKLGLRIAISGRNPLIDFTYRSALNFSFCVLTLVFPSRISPVFKPKRLI